MVLPNRHTPAWTWRYYTATHVIIVLDMSLFRKPGHKRSAAIYYIICVCVYVYWTFLRTWVLACDTLGNGSVMQPKGTSP